ncbi:MAG TPA: hypothetical protein VD886_09605, partial [Herpetosiphonaceae bacterium]|nr:hypothetical protein [Herpetosiphonaceae bacterium]
LGGINLLVVFGTLLVLAAWIGVYRLCEGPPRVRIIVMLIGMVAQSTGWSVRPQLLSQAFFVLALLLVSQPRRHWLYPPLFLLWANVHAGVASGALVLIAAAAAAIWRFRAQAWRWLAIGAASALASLLNPLGWNIWLYALGSVNSVARKFITEWQPPRLNYPNSYPFLVLAALVLLVAWLGRRSWATHRDWTFVLCAGLLLLLGAQSLRHTAIFTLLATPLLSHPFRAVAAQPPVPPAIGWLNGLLPLGALVGGIFLVANAWSARPAPFAPELVAGVRACQGTLFNTFDYGGELIWFVPERPVFIDNRQDPYPDQLFIDAGLAEESGDYRELFARYDIACAMVPVGQKIYPALVGDGWAEIVRTDTLAVLRR